MPPNEDECEIYGKKDIKLPLNSSSLAKVVQELGIIQLDWPPISEPEYANRTSFPEPYYKSGNKEKLLLAYAENFRRQFVHDYPERRPLLLQAANECGLQKMVCTTIRPTRIPIPEFLTWQGCANFVADFCSYEPLSRKILLPDRIISPVSVLKGRRGSCFELATLLASLLCTARCDAYVVVGRATADRAEGILARTECPLRPDDEEDASASDEPKVERRGRYEVEPPVAFLSEHLRTCERRRLERIAVENAKLEEERMKIIKEMEKPPHDSLQGWRLHGWILVVSVKNMDGESDDLHPFYIEPSTGVRHELDDPDYLSVESVYNHENYYVNLSKDKPSLFEFDDRNVWEKLLCKETSAGVDGDSSLEKYLDMPASWVEKLEITINDVEQRYPNGKKTIRYKKCIVEKFSLFSREDGLSRKLTKYADYDYETPLNWYEWYENRADQLRKISFDHSSNLITEYFNRGRSDYLKKHSYEVAMENREEAEQIGEFHFYPKSPYDQYVSISIAPAMIIEHYHNREDRLAMRKILYLITSTKPNIRTLISVIETYHRNESKTADENIAEKFYSIANKTVTITYHYDENSIIQKKVSFRVPTTFEGGDLIVFSSDFILESDMAPIKIKEISNVKLYKLIRQYSDEMKNSKHHVAELEEKIKLYNEIRSFELKNPSLLIPLFYTERNEKIKESLKKKEMEEKKLLDREMKEYGLSPGIPFMIKEGTASATVKTNQLCLEDFKETQLKRQNNLQKKYDECIKNLKEQEILYLSQKHTMQPVEESKLFDTVYHLYFEIETLEAQLQRNEKLGAIRFKKLLITLQNDLIRG